MLFSCYIPITLIALSISCLSSRGFLVEVKQTTVRAQNEWQLIMTPLPSYYGGYKAICTSLQAIGQATPRQLHQHGYEMAWNHAASAETSSGVPPFLWRAILIKSSMSGLMHPLGKHFLTLSLHTILNICISIFPQFCLLHVSCATWAFVF